MRVSRLAKQHFMSKHAFPNGLTGQMNLIQRKKFSSNDERVSHIDETGFAFNA